jgi:hypothetical protein
MTASRRIGPLVAYGPLYGAPAQGMPEYAADAGPGIHYQGWSIPDLRAVNQKDYGIQGAMPAHLTNPRILSVDITPIALGTAKVAALQNVPAGLTLTFAAIGSGFSTGVSIVNAATGQIVTGLAALDFGFGLISTTSGSTTITPASGTMDFYYPGQWLCIPNGLTATTTLFTRVVSVGASTIVVSTAPGVTSSTIRAGSASPLAWGAVYQDNVVPLVAWPYLNGGYGAMLDPAQAVGRAVSITGSASSAGQNFTVRGYDAYGFPMSEVIAGPAGATTTSGKKAFKYIASITGTSAEAQNYSVGTLDIFGFPIRSDNFGQVQIVYNNAAITASTGYVAAVTTNPATGTTGDVRGTYAVQSATDGAKRLQIYQTPASVNVVNATPANPVPLYGVAQFSN